MTWFGVGFGLAWICWVLVFWFRFGVFGFRFSLDCYLVFRAGLIVCLWGIVASVGGFNNWFVCVLVFETVDLCVGICFVLLFTVVCFVWY